jgi:hypothetical protein
MASADLRKHAHAHGCRRCHTRYRDACATPSDNALCFTCRTGRAGFVELLHGQAPRDCCQRHARLVNKEERAGYYLGGDSAWHICTVCKRTFPYEVPTERTRSA